MRPVDELTPTCGCKTVREHRERCPHHLPPVIVALAADPGSRRGIERTAGRLAQIAVEGRPMVERSARNIIGIAKAFASHDRRRDREARCPRRPLVRARSSCPGRRRPGRRSTSRSAGGGSSGDPDGEEPAGEPVGRRPGHRHVEQRRAVVV